MNLHPALSRGRAVATLALSIGLASSSFAADTTALVYGIQDPGNAVVSFRSAAPGRLLNRVVIVGLQPGERIVGLDVRPSTGELYALGSTSRIYLLDPTTGVVTPVGGSPFAPGLGGLAFGFDFNPVPDRIRLTSDVEQNQRLHPDTGVTAAQDTLLSYDAADVNAGKDPGIAGSAYTSSFAGTSTTTLFDIDSNLDVLVRQGSVNASPLSPDGGKLFTIGALGVDTTNLVGFDISPFGGALAALNPVGMKVSRLFNVNLETGAATLIGTIGGGRPLVGLAIAPPTAPRMVALTTAGRLVSFAPGRPGTLLSDVAISGLAPNESLVGIDVRPSTGELVGVGDSSRVYVIDPLTGSATAVGPVFTPALAGVDFAVDFNPIPDRIRLVSDAEQNLRLNPNTGLVAASDASIAYDAADLNVGANPNVVAAAYTNPNAGATITTLYAIDSNLDVLVTQGSLNSAPVSPNSGLLFTVGALGQDTTGLAGMDVSQFGGAYASLTATGATQSRLFRLNLATGATALVGTIGASTPVKDVAFLQAVAPQFVGITASSKVVTFVPGKPGAATVSVRGLAGLAVGETLVGIDVRPGTGALYGVTTANRVVTIDLAQSKVNAVTATTFSPALAGTQFGVDFNPIPDRIRLVSDARQNLRLDPSTGLVTNTDGLLTFDALDVNANAIPSVSAAAYTNSFSGSTKTTLYVIDGALGALCTQGSLNSAPVSPNSGTLFTIGALGQSATGAVGFDVTPFSTAFATLELTGQNASQLVSINLSTGVATALGTIGGGERIVAFAAVAP
ncbi:MAG: DUF4394 domain-containing protein [Planctomycetes bacterium]|nr:DUF4394 domain-containing protein [Planctomycetota bacterium]